MKKFLLSMAAAAAVVCSANAEGLYAVGGFQGWDIANPTAFEATADGYKLTIPELTSFKISSVNDGTWDGFNAAGLNPETPFDNTDQARTLAPGDADINMPWTGDWTITVTTDLTSMTITTTTPRPQGFAEIYLRGGMNGWGAEPNWQMQTEDGVIYTLSNVEVGTEEFKVADANWGNINYGLSAGELFLGEATELVYNAGNIVVNYEGDAPAPLTFVFNLNDHTLLVDFATGISAISSDNEAPVYYNIQGVRVDNPRGGLFIRQQDNKVTKVIK